MSAPSVSARPRPVTPLGLLARELTELAAYDGLPREVAGRLALARDLAAGLDPYVEAGTSPPSPALAALARRTAAIDWAGVSAEVPLEQEMLSGHVEGELLATLVHVTGARRVLEVGMFTGYSALAMAEAVAVTAPDDGCVVACELDLGVAGVAQECFRASPSGWRVRVEVGPADATLRRLAAAGERFDLVFVDADKAGYAGYVDQLLADDLLAPHGLLVVDNTLMQGQPWLPGARSANGDAIAAFNAWLAADPRVRQVLLPVRDGVTLVRRVAP